jgi:predicted kinase
MSQLQCTINGRMNTLPVYILIGAPGCGKSTHAEKLVKDNPNLVRVCPDDFRALLGTDSGDQSVSWPAFKASYEAMETALSEGKGVVIDATNMYRKARKEWIKIARKYNTTINALVFMPSKEVLLERNKLRGEAGGRNVPESVIDDMLTRYQCPTNDEIDNLEFIS